MRSNVLAPPVLAFLTILTACSLTGATATTESDALRLACQAFAPITFSASQDSAETIAEIREHNAAYDALGCP